MECALCDAALGAIHPLRYQRIAGGGDGPTVYLVPDRGLMVKLFSLDVMQLDEPGSETPLEAWLREVLIYRFAAQQQQPPLSLPRFESAGVLPKAAWLCTDACQETLRDWIVRTLATAVASGGASVTAHDAIVAAVQRILEVALTLHKLGVIHGDFHLGNVMTATLASDAAAAEPTWQLIDFGLARLTALGREKFLLWQQTQQPFIALGLQYSGGVLSDAEVAAAAKREWLGLPEVLSASTPEQMNLDALLAGGYSGMATQRALVRMQPQYLDAFGSDGLRIENPILDLIELTNELWKLLVPEDFPPVANLSASAREQTAHIRELWELSRRWLFIKIKHRVNMFIRAHSDVYAVDYLQDASVYPIFH